MSLSTLCQVKTAIDLDPDTYPNLWELYWDDDFTSEQWEALISSEIYKYWDYVGDDGSGHRVIIIFETSDIPHQQDFIKLVNSFSRLETKLTNQSVVYGCLGNALVGNDRGETARG